MKKILLLGSGELGKELTISLKRMGCYVITCDSYVDAPAMQVSDVYEVFNMLDKDKLKLVIEKHKPDFIVPEVEAIETEVLVEAETNGYTVIPSAKAVNLTMNRDKIRDRSKSIAGMQLAKALEGRLGLIIDSTARDVEKIQQEAKNLRNLGYDILVQPQ